MCRFDQIFHFVLKNHHNFKSYQNMITTLGFTFLYQKLELCLIFPIYSTPFTCGKGLLRFWNILWSFFKFTFHNFLIVNVLWAWIISYYCLNFLSPIFFSKRLLYPSPFKNWLLLMQQLFKLKTFLLKPKPNF